MSQSAIDVGVLGPKEFAKAFGVAESALDPLVRKAIAEGDFRYAVPGARERDTIILQVLEYLDSDKPTLVGEHRAAIWESCWSDNLKRFAAAEYQADKLVPDFIKAGRPARLNQDYVLPTSENFEQALLRLCVLHLSSQYLGGCESIFEFGCGSGSNLVSIAEQRPGIKLYGMDWSPSSNRTVNLLKSEMGIDIEGRHFDFFHPDDKTRVVPTSGVLTVCALEQVGPRHQEFVKFLLDRKPKICVHMEPIAEFYDPGNLVDYLALRYHRKRGYLDGFLPSLRELERRGVIRILEARRFGFGSLYHEGYNVVVWQAVA